MHVHARQERRWGGHGRWSLAPDRVVRETSSLVAGSLVVLVGLFVGASSALWSAAPARAWPSAIGSPFAEQAKAVATDSSGNTYVAGTFNGVLSASDRTISPIGGRDVFVAKLNPLGSVLWLASAGSDRDDGVGGIGVDIGGNVYVTGTFFQTLFFAADEKIVDPLDLRLTAAPGSFSSTQCSVAAITSDVFVAKLDKDGKWLWAARAGGKGFDEGRDLAVHANGVYVTGRYAHTLPFADAGSSMSAAAMLPVPNDRPAELNGWDGPFCGGEQTATRDFYANQATTGCSSGSNGNNHPCLGSLNSGSFLFSDRLDGTCAETIAINLISCPLGAETVVQNDCQFDCNSLVASYATSHSVVSISAQVSLATQFGSLQTYECVCRVTEAQNCPADDSSFDPECQRRSDMFVARIDSQGKWTWATRGGAAVPDASSGDAIAVDGSLNVYVAGTRIPTGSAAPDTSFLVKVEDGGTAGQVLYRFGDLQFAAVDVATDGLQNVVVGGTAEQQVTIGATTVFGAPSPVPVVARFTDAGDTFHGQWASGAIALGSECSGSTCRQLAGAAAGAGVAFDGTGNAYLSGYFAPPDLVQVSDFETPGAVPSFDSYVTGQFVAGWVVDGSVDHLGTFQRAASGQRSIDLNGSGPSSIIRGVQTFAGHRYLVRFALAGNTHAGNLVPDKRLQVLWNFAAIPSSLCKTAVPSQRVTFANNEIRFDSRGLSLGNPGWEEVACEVTATGPVTFVTFQSLTLMSASGPTIDHVRIVALDADAGSGLRFDPGQLILSTVSPDSGLDAFVASVDAVGSWRWAQRAGGTESDSAVAIATGDGGELVAVGEFGDTAAFENQPPNESAALVSGGAPDVFAARITDAGQWVAFQKWVVGQEVPRPAGACGPGNASCPQARQPVVDLGGGNLSVDAFFLWAQFDQKLFAIAPTTATIKWFETPTQQVPTRATTGTTDFPGFGGRSGFAQTHVATAPVDVELNPAVPRCGAGGDHPLFACRDERNNPTPECGTSPACGPLGQNDIHTLIVRESDKPSFTNNGARIVVDRQRKVFHADGPGHSVLVYVNAPQPDPTQGAVSVDVVRSVLPHGHCQGTGQHAGQSCVEDADCGPSAPCGLPAAGSCTIGTPLADAGHRDPNRRNGWVFKQASGYDGAGIDRAHDRATRGGPIIPVNEDAPADSSDDMIVAWYRQNTKGIAWPDKAVRYDCQWPANPDRIVIASGIGSEQSRCAGASVQRGSPCGQDDECGPAYTGPPGTCILIQRCDASGCTTTGGCAGGPMPGGSCLTDDECAAPRCELQPAFDPAVFPEARIYDQPEREGPTGEPLPGFNPNEEHALLARSNTGNPFPAVFALRNDLGDPKDSAINDLSEPYVLLKYRDPQADEWRMRVYEVLAEQGPFTFNYGVEAGQQIAPPYPLNILPPCTESCAPNLVDCGGATASCQMPLGRCVGGPLQGAPCDVDRKCPGGTCEPEPGTVALCAGGPRHGHVCMSVADCRAGPLCRAADDSGINRCAGGSLEGAPCNVDPDCQSECTSLCGAATSDNLPLFKDYRGLGDQGSWVGWWARAAGAVKTQYFYPLQNGFYSTGFDLDHDGAEDDPPGTCVPWLDRYARAQGSPDNANRFPPPVTLTYASAWPMSPPPLEVGQTLLRPTTCNDPTGGDCLPNIADQAAAEVIFEQRSDTALPQDDRGDLVRLFDPLAERAVFLGQIPDDLTTDRDGARTVITGNILGDKIPFALRARLSFEPGPFSICDGGVNDTLACVRNNLSACPGGACKVGGRLRFRGRFDDRNLGEPLLLPNILTDDEWAFLRGLSSTSGLKTVDYQGAIDKLFQKTRNPNRVQRAGAATCHHPEIAGACPLEIGFVPDMASGVKPENVLETKALSAGDARSEGRLTVIFNNDRRLGPAPVSAKVISVACGPYQGQVQVIQPDNVFDEQLTLRHNGDFGGDPSRLDFEWYYALKEKDCKSITALPPTLPWTRLAGGPGVVQVTLEGPSITTLADTCIFTRYFGYGVCNNTRDDPSQWAGAPLGDPTQSTNPKSQLAPGWLARVVRALNPFDSRTKDFRDSPVNTFASMIVQAGKRYEGDIAFNGDASNLNRIGLIESYETVLRRGFDLSIDHGVNIDAVNTKLLDVSSRIAGLYMLLGNEAFADAQDPTIGFDTSGEFGTLAPAIFAFQDQMDSLLSEELALLRGREDGSGPTPVYNRLIWNFTGSTGQVAYQQNYNVRDQDTDGFINEFDARLLFPQGHGDAWGHYLTALTAYYRLLRHSNFRWVPRSDSVLVAGSEVLVDFTDERKFADAAAARARAGAQIVDLTYRQRWVDDPSGQWQGYKDTDPDRGFGVAEWAARAGQGAYFDWVVANGVLPAASDQPPGIEKIDRTTVPELQELVSQFNEVQAKLDQVDAGLNPVGLAKNVVPFDIDPTFLDTGSTTSVGTRAIQGLSHFEQIYERALGAFKNAVRVFDNANSLTELLRRNQDTVDDFRQNVIEQERDYNNRLIETFGSPYPEDIGPGKTYPSGYTGPDLWNFDVVEQSELTGGDPGEIEGALTCTAEADDFARGRPCTSDTDCPGGACRPGGDFTAFALQSVVPRMLDCEQGERTETCKFDPAAGRFEYDDEGFPVTDKVTVTIRLSNAGFGRVKDPSWTRRLSPGEMQMAHSDFIQALGQFRRAVADHRRAVNLIECDMSTIRGRNNLADDLIDVLETKRDEKKKLGKAITGMKAAQLAFARAANLIDKASGDVKGVLPTVAGLAFDPSAPARAAITAVAVPKYAIASYGADAAELAQTALEQAQNAQDDIAEVRSTLLEQDFELFTLLAAIGQHVKEEAVARAEALTALEAVRQAQAKVDATLAGGLRLYDELIAFRRKTAAQVADVRYNDMAFRIFRNDALQKYKAQFDLTTQYVYLTAAAYDYETNLLGTENNAGRRFLTDIVRHRSLGQVIDNEPIVGSRGLADPMGRMRANFDVIDSQLGFNKPESETNRFSLRRELFRILAAESLCAADDDACLQDPDTVAQLEVSGSKWREALERHRVADLWSVADFRRFARPFAPETAGPQPGIVIPFDTNVISGLNFFGWPLAGGDSAYDPSSFSTKVRAVGVWFSDYNGRNLANTPRVYLIPVGADVLRPLSALDFTPREFLIFDQKIPVPFPIGSTDLTDPAWSPMLDTLGGSSVEIRRYDGVRAFHDSGFTQDELTFDSRAVGRSVWNTRWVLMIPGGTLLNDQQEGLNAFIYGKPLVDGPVVDPNGIARDGSGISDISMFFQTYAYSGN